MAKSKMKRKKAAKVRPQAPDLVKQQSDTSDVNSASTMLLMTGLVSNRILRDLRRVRPTGRHFISYRMQSLAGGSGAC